MFYSVAIILEYFICLVNDIDIVNVCPQSRTIVVVDASAADY